ncbi:zf-HC2 domain-containing protein [bacterium]|nr:zf-HC2 domain-containing protein [bacterium]
MDCRAFKKLFSLFVDGELDERRNERARKHLAVCPLCCRLVAAYRAGADSLERQARLEPPADLFERVMGAVGQAPATAVRPRVRRERPSLSLLRPRVMLPGLAAAAAALSFGIFLLIGGGAQPEPAPFMVQVDSTMDMINYQVAEQLARKENSQRARAVQLASYARVEDESSQKSGISRSPVIVLSGVSDFAE